MSNQTKKAWDRRDYQGKTQKQVTDSCKIITWGIIGMIVLLVLSMIFKF